MRKRAKWIIITSTVMLGVAGLIVGILVFQPLDLIEACGEFLLPTTVETVPVPPSCTETAEGPPPDLLRVVNNQKDLYQLELQKLIVCKTTQRLPALERRFPGLPFGEEFRMRWRPLTEGCCSAQHGRHILIVVAGSNDNGSVVVEAALVKPRWDYLVENWRKVRQKWDRVRTYW